MAEEPGIIKLDEERLKRRPENPEPPAPKDPASSAALRVEDASKPRVLDLDTERETRRIDIVTGTVPPLKKAA